MEYLSFHFKDIHKNKIGDEGVKYLRENINKISKLKHLSLNNNGISDEGGEMLLDRIHKCKRLENLSVHHNKISQYYSFKPRIKQAHPNSKLEVDPW